MPIRERTCLFAALFFRSASGVELHRFERASAGRHGGTASRAAEHLKTGFRVQFC